MSSILTPNLLPKQVPPTLLFHLAIAATSKVEEESSLLLLLLRALAAAATKEAEALLRVARVVRPKAEAKPTNVFASKEVLVG